jgi:hypothetical protein
MNSMPLLSSHNHFNVLNIEKIKNDIETETQDVQKFETPSTSALVTNFCAKDCHPKWERLPPKKFTVAAMEGNFTSPKLKVEIETTDTAERSSITALVDSRATGEFIDRHYAKSSHLNIVKLTQPIPVYNIDGTLNEAGSITEVVTLILCYNNHLERTTFAISGLDRQKTNPGTFLALQAQPRDQLAQRGS